MPHLKPQVIILAAGEGSRMQSGLPKVCHTLGGRSLLHYVLDAAFQLDPKRLTVVVGQGRDAVEQSLEDYAQTHHCTINKSVQDEQLGTGHAVMAARDHWQDFHGPVLVLFADTPLLSPQTLEAMLRAYQGDKSPAIVTLGMRCETPNRYGRIEQDSQGLVTAIVEYQDATPAQRDNPLCNSGVMLIDGNRLSSLIDQLDCRNEQKEYYLTDLVALARQQGQAVVCVEGEESELLGVNTRVDLAKAESTLQAKWRQQAMLAGATLMDPDTVYFSFDTQLGRDVTIFPHVYFGPGVQVADHVTIRPFCHIQQAQIAEHATIGPFAHLRPGSQIGAHSRIGNFVEIKQSVIGTGAKVNHLSYVGDTEVGESANIGAGTITCNYDGYSKHKTKIGAKAFIGSNSCLVAPVEIGDQAIVGAGSVITRSIPGEALAYSRASQQNLTEGAVKYRLRKNRSV